MTPKERSLRGRIGAYNLHAQGKTNTGPAHAKFMERFAREVDPLLELPEAERQKRAAAAKKAYFSSLALKRAKSRRSRGGFSSRKPIQLENLSTD